ncbi:MAG: hypothetical protein ACPH5Z_07990 [Flavobacteriaceae bacterium]
MENNDKHGLAINILKFQYYNSNYFNCQEVVLFETLIVLGGASFAGKKEFFHSTQTLADKTMIKRHTVDRILKKFKTEGIIDYKIKGMPQVKYLRVLWDNVLELLPEIYQFNKVEEYFGGSTKPLIYFYQQFADNDKKVAENKEQKNIIKNSTKEYKEEYEEEYYDYAIAKRNVVVDNFKVFLDQLFEFKDTPRKEFESEDLMKALNHHNLDVIQDYIEMRYRTINVFDMRKFFKFSRSGRIIGLDLFCKTQQDEVVEFIESLKSKFQDRIEHYNENGNRAKNYTPLPVKKSVVGKIDKVLKVKGPMEIKDAFVAYADDILYMRINPKLDALSYFLKEEDGEYPVIDKYQLKYICEYSFG